NYFNVINEVNLQEEKTQDNNIALRLYYAKSGERVWDIAKSFNTSMKSIKSENDFEAERLSKNCMMIIPME
ncbi:MAG: LysM peptidoglycan-binding domain-containing protein, partial [Oscillospiraceae bacterium]